MKTNLIGISGKIGSGKDTVGKILQYLSGNNPQNFIFEEWLDTVHYVESNYQIKKFADKLKDIVCLLIGCTREQLEDREFKEKELGQEWNIWVLVPNPDHNLFDGNCQLQEAIFSSSDEAKNYIKEHKIINVLDIEERALTPRKLLQLLGTDCGREIIHPKIWVNALFADYTEAYRGLPSEYESGMKSFPNWIITDVRFPNEAQAVKDRGGVVIRVNRNASELERCLKDPVYFVENYTTVNGNKINLRNVDKSFILEHFTYKKEHPSETVLDDYEFDYVIDNNGSIEELVEKVKQLKLM